MANTSKGRFPSYGLVRGPSHSQGGVPASVANGPDVELEGGEYIIPKEAVPDYLPVLQQITQVGRDRQQMQNGNSAIDALIASASMQNGIAQPKSPVYQEGGRVSFLEKLPLIGNQLRGYREFQEAEDFIGRQNPDSPLFSEEVQQRGIQAGGEFENQQKSKNNKTVTDLVQSAMYNYDPQELSRGIATFAKSDQGKSVLNKLLVGTPEGYTVEEDDGRASRFVGRENIAQSERGKKLLGLFPVGYSGSVEPNIEGNYQLDFSDLDALKALAGYQQGGMVQYEDGGEVHSRRMYNQGTGFNKKKSDLDGDGKISEYERKRGMAIAKAMGKMQMGGMVNGQPIMQRPMNPAMNFSPMQRMNPRMYQEGGQVQPRKQFELRNPETFIGPPDSLIGRVYMNPFTGEFEDADAQDKRIEEHIKRLRQRMKQSEIPISKERVPMQEGGQVNVNSRMGTTVSAKDLGLKNLGEVTSIPPQFQMSRPEFEAILNYGNNSQQDEITQEEKMANFMSLLENEKRVRPIPPDKYIVKDGVMSKVEINVPKLTSAYMSSYGIATPLSRNQGRMLQRKMIAPETLNPQVKGLLNRILVQRLAAEEN